MQNRPERCVLQRSSTQRFKKVSAVSLGREFICVQDLFFDLGQTPRIFKNLLKVPVSIL